MVANNFSGQISTFGKTHWRIDCMFGAAIRKQLWMFQMLNEGNCANIWPALELN